MIQFSSEKLQALRKEQKITQEKLAEDCGVDATTVSGWENGKWKPSLQNIFALAHALHISVEDLCDGQSTYNSEDITVNQITDELNSLSPQELEYVLTMIQGIKNLRHSS